MRDGQHDAWCEVCKQPSSPGAALGAAHVEGLGRVHVFPDLADEVAIVYIRTRCPKAPGAAHVKGLRRVRARPALTKGWAHTDTSKPSTCVLAPSGSGQRRYIHSGDLAIKGWANTNTPEPLHVRRCARPHLRGLWKMRTRRSISACTVPAAALGNQAIRPDFRHASLYLVSRCNLLHLKDQFFRHAAFFSLSIRFSAKHGDSL